jgi:hypothetical protein
MGKSMDKVLAPLLNEIRTEGLLDSWARELKRARKNRYMPKKEIRGRKEIADTLDPAGEYQGPGFHAEAAKQRNEGKWAAIVAAAKGGKGIEQARESAAPARAVEAEEETAALIREKRRLERTVESLNRRLEEIKRRLIDCVNDDGDES